MASDEFLNLFDMFVKWPQRLGKEGPFVERLLEEVKARRIVDAGAGSGRHAVYLAGKGYEVVASDAAECMVDETRRHAEQEGVTVSALVCSFEDVPDHVAEPVDAVLCLGNSLSMLPDPAAVERALRAFARVLRPGGLLVAHILNYGGLRARNKRISRPTALPDGALLLKVFDLDPGAARVNFIRLWEDGPGTWKSEHRFAPLLDLSREDLASLLEDAGFGCGEFFGSADGTPYHPVDSHDLFVKAIRS